MHECRVNAQRKFLRPYPLSSFFLIRELWHHPDIILPSTSWRWSPAIFVLTNLPVILQVDCGGESQQSELVICLGKNWKLILVFPFLNIPCCSFISSSSLPLLKGFVVFIFFLKFFPLSCFLHCPHLFQASYFCFVCLF